MKKIFFLTALALFTLPCVQALPDAAAGLDFYKQELSSFPAKNNRENRAYARALAEGLATWVRQHPQEPSVQEALLMQTRLWLQAQEPGAAAVTLFQLRHQFAQADVALLQPLFTQALDGLDKPSRQTALQLFAQNPQASAPLPTRQAGALFLLSKLSGKSFYAPAQQAFEAFFTDHPSYENNHEVELWQGDLHRLNGNYLAAISQYKKAAQLYPQSPYQAASLRLMGDIYADNLKNTAAALELYTRVLREYPGSAEVATVYKHMAILDENNKQYDNALINYEKAIELLGTSDSGYEACLGKADVLVKMKDFPAAYQSLEQTAAAFAQNGQKAAQAYARAAEIAKKNLRDNARYTQALEKALLANPGHTQAPQWLYDLGQAYEQQGKTDAAQKAYKKLVLQYPTHKLAARAQGRLAKLAK